MQPASDQNQLFSLDTPLFHFDKGDDWTIRDACEGVQIFGALGSGKTSGSGKAIAHAFLRNGFGGLVLTAKPDERETWEKYAEATGRAEDLIIFSPDGLFRFNFLDYEMKRSGKGAGETENVVTLFTNVLETIGNGGGGGGDPFWQFSVQQMLRNSIDLVKYAGEPRLLLGTIKDVIRTAPNTLAETRSTEWQSGSVCWSLLKKAFDRSDGFSAMEKRELQSTEQYWMWEFPALSEKTRSIIVTMFSSMADTFLRGNLHDLFCSEMNIAPEMSLHGKIFILDLPVKEYGHRGRFAQVLFKYMWQQAIERRNAAEHPRPVFLWADEAQNFVSSYDVQFQATARSSRACTVYLTQNLPNYYAALGDGDKGKQETDAFVGNLQTKIFHANGDSVTNNWAAEAIGKKWQKKTSTGANSTEEGPSGYNIGTNEVLEYEVLPREFTMLRKGGKHNNLQVDAVVFQGGRKWKATGSNFLRTTFEQ